MSISNVRTNYLSQLGVKLSAQRVKPRRQIWRIEAHSV